MLSLLLALACPSPDPADTGEAPVPEDPTPEEVGGDILHVDLDVDLATRSATAIVHVVGDQVSLEVGGLEVVRVYADGEDLEWIVDAGVLVAAIPPSGRVGVDYTFPVSAEWEGYGPTGSTLTWPYHCGNLFPCQSEPVEGQTFSLRLDGVPLGQEAVYAEEIVLDAPAYQLAWAVGELERIDWGTTAAGTEVAVWAWDGDPEGPAAQTATLLPALDWLEQTLGPYPYGPLAGSVQVDWGPGAIGGMEHHPIWHVGGSAGHANYQTNIHEAAHAWYGDGVRIACWEDFVLSEGTATYLAARAILHADPEHADQVWEDYREDLERAVRLGDHVAWPDSCGEVDVYDIFTLIPYMKGAFFYRAVAEEVGEAVLDGALASFAATHLGDAVGMADMIGHIEAETGFDPWPLAEAWLRGEGIPE